MKQSNDPDYCVRESQCDQAEDFCCDGRQCANFKPPCSTCGDKKVVETQGYIDHCPKCSKE